MIKNRFSFLHIPKPRHRAPKMKRKVMTVFFVMLGTGDFKGPALERKK
jgi:hypothetical protein